MDKGNKSNIISIVLLVASTAEVLANLPLTLQAFLIVLIAFVWLFVFSKKTRQLLDEKRLGL